MKRLLTLLLAAAILCSLFGCAQQNQGEATKPVDRSTSILIDQACRLAQTLAMSTDPDYLHALAYSDEIIGYAAAFGEAIGKDPAEAKVATIGEADFLSRVTEICGKANGSYHVACCSMLTFSTQFYMGNTPAASTAVYLRFNAQCHMLVFFTSERSHIVNATVYPLFSETAQILLEEDFEDARTLTSADIQKAQKLVASVSVAANYTDNKTNQLHYLKLATTAFVDTQTIDPAQIKVLTDDEAVMQMAEQFAQVIHKQPTGCVVFHFPASAKKETTQVLSQTKYGKELAEITNRRFYLNSISSFTKQFGEECVTANAILSSLAGNRPLGYVANKNAVPALVVLELSADVTLLMCIYPGENNIYDYSFVCIPASFGETCNLVRKSGAQQFN